ncbi:MAG: AraC family transcriptional regulator, partial [Achromobacter marplatensis]
MKTVAIVVFPGVQSLDVSGPLDVFAEANRFLLPAQHYQLELIGLTRGTVPCSNGMG